ncbi:DUF5979 domain-containing protein [Nonomuraea turcica]|uniref:DUF5979 domain-containing protein n=1 Tax=Nonomuraea sp. G32 TaxID=3067274 RepID=UPI00273A8CF8|nr:DUF5979 domain-containing protein [Nonomuraea sp. G32]MDP4500958.1 DUF5979 domain-containing protein [Nonomuraea sp. G32]
MSKPTITGQRGKIVIEVVCHGTETSLNRRYVRSLRAGTSADTYRRTINEIPAGSVCTINEPNTGATRKVAAAKPVISDHSVTIEAGETQRATVTNTFRWRKDVHEYDRKKKPADRQDALILLGQCRDVKV